MLFDVISYVIGYKKGGGGAAIITVESITLTKNGDYTAPENTAYSPVYVRIHEAEQAVPVMTVDGDTVTATVTQDAGVVEAGVKTASATVSSAIQATPTISVNTETGKITASATQTEGYVSAGTKTETAQLSTQAATTITPTTSNQTAVAANKYTLGAVTVAGDPDLVAGNIKNGVGIFGVTGTFTSDANATAGDVLYGKTAYVNGEKVTGNIPSRIASDMSVSGKTVTAPAGYYPNDTSKSVLSATQATPSVAIDTSTGLVTATATQSAGYVSAGEKSGTLQLSTQAAATITPSTVSQTAVAAEKYTTGAVTVAGDADLVSGNIKDGVSIFGVEGTFKGVDTTDATATAEDILSPKTAYISTGKVQGTIATKTGADLIVSGASVTVPSGYYADNVTESVSAGSATTPATTITANPSISVSAGGLVTATTSAAKSVTPTVSAGYVSSGTAGTVTVSGSATQQLTVQEAQTITPGTTAQTIAAGKYLTGTQTISGDANLVSGNIASGVDVFGVTGTYTNDANAAAGDILSGKTAYVVGTKLSGSIQTKTGADMTVSGLTVTAPAGYYASAASKTVPTNFAGSYTKTEPDITYYGAGTDLSAARIYATGVTVGNYALFADGSGLTIVDAYDTSLTRSVATSTDVGRQQPRSAKVGNYALINGDTTIDDTVVDVYDTSLTHSLAPALTQGAYSSTASCNQNYALMAGGYVGAAAYTKTVTAYDASLTKSNPTGLSYNTKQPITGRAGEYALFAGGSNSTSPYYTDVVNAYSASLVRSNPAALSVAKTGAISASVVGRVNHAVFAGGMTVSYQRIDGVDVYDGSLTHSVATSLSEARASGGGTGVGDFALIMGGPRTSSNNSGSLYVDVYDASLTHSLAPNLPIGTGFNGATSLGNYAITAGGRDTGNESSTAAVYVYEYIPTKITVSLSNDTDPTMFNATGTISGAVTAT